jgi:amidohydrolase
MRSLPVCAILISFSAAAEITPARLEPAAAAIDAKVIAWRRDIHQHPELGNREFRTSALVAAHLQRLGLEVKTGIAHTGVAGILRGGRPGPVVGLRADMDALPIAEDTDLPFKSTVTSDYRGAKVGVMHACGHDAHTAILMGVAEALTALRSDLPGTVLFIFQPAEEGAPDGEKAGAKQMLDEGLFELARPEAVFGLHVAPTARTGVLGYRSGSFYSSSSYFRIVVRGRQTHGARPWAGIDPIVVASQIVLGLQTIVSRQTDISPAPAIVTVGAIHGGVRENIIPETVEMIGTVRTFDDAVRDDILTRMRRTAEHIASASGATAEMSLTGRGYPVTVNHPELTARMVPVLGRAVGVENVRIVPFVTAAEDFSEYARLVPGLFFTLGVTSPDRDPRTAAPVHSPRFLLDEAALGVGVRALLHAAVGYLSTAAAATR